MFKPLKILVEIYLWDDDNDRYCHFTADGGFLYFKYYGNGQVAITTNKTPQIVKTHFSGPKGFIVLPPISGTLGSGPSDP